MWNFETNVIKRDAHVSLLRCKFLGYRESKEEEKGDQGCRKIVVRYSMGNRNGNRFHCPMPAKGAWWQARRSARSCRPWARLRRLRKQWRAGARWPPRRSWSGSTTSWPRLPRSRPALVVDPEVGPGADSEGRNADEAVTAAGVAATAVDVADTVADVAETEEQAADRR